MERLRDLSEFTLDPDAIARLGRGFCKRKHVVILGSMPEDETAPVHMGMVHPGDQALIAILRAHLGRPIQPHKLTAEAIDQALQTGAAATLDMPELRWGDADAPDEETPLGRAVLDLLQRALVARATALHLSATHACARARIDGQLVAFPSVLRDDNAQAFAAHLLDRAGLPSAPTQPVHGRFEGEFVPAGETTSRTVAFEVTATPGETAPHLTVTLDDGQLPALALAALGMTQAQQQLCLAALEAPGVVLLGGPARSGRTTTLYALLEASAAPHRACALVEEHRARGLSGPSQSACERLHAAVGPDSGPLRHLRRHLWNADWDRLALDPADDPDLQRELWAQEPSGRSTLAVVRSFGVDPLLRQLSARHVDTEALGQSLRATVHQRLLRRVCPSCVTTAPSNPRVEAVRAAWGQPLPFLRATGCELCGGLGFRGRIGIFEVSGWPARQARPRSTHAALWSAGLARVEAQDTTLEELWTVLGPPPQSLPHVSHAP